MKQEELAKELGKQMADYYDGTIFKALENVDVYHQWRAPVEQRKAYFDKVMIEGHKDRIIRDHRDEVLDYLKEKYPEDFI